MRGRRFAKRGARYRVGRGALGRGKKRINVEKIVALGTWLYRAMPVSQILAMFVVASQEFWDELDDAVESRGLSEEYTGQIRKDLDDWGTRLSYYQATIAHLQSGEPFILNDEGQLDPQGDLEFERADYVDVYMARPLLKGDGFSHPTESPDSYARFPDLGEGFRIANQLNAVGWTFDHATLLEKSFGIWIEAAAQIKQTPWGQERAAQLDTAMTQIKLQIQDVGDFIDKTLAKAGPGILGLVLAGLIVYGVTKGLDR